MKRTIGFAILLTVAVVVMAQTGERNIPTAEPLIPGQSRLVQVTNFPDPQTVAGSVSVDNLPAIQPVSGSVMVDNFPDVQSVSGTVEVSNLPTATDRIQLVGFTAATFQGNVGVFTFNQACDTEFPDSRMCTIEEALKTTNIPLLTGWAWIRSGQAPYDNDTDCRGWRSAGSTDKGLVLFDNGAYSEVGCQGERAVACCGPTQ